MLLSLPKKETQLQQPQQTNMSPFDSPQTTSETSNNSTSPSGDVLMKWGHKKRSRVTRAAIEDSSSSVHTKNKRVLPTKISSSSMPPPPPLVSSSTATASNGRGRKDNHRPRTLEGPSTAGSESSPSRSNQVVVSKSAAQKVSTTSCTERSNRRMASSGSAKCQKPNGATSTTAHAAASTEGLNNGHVDYASMQSEGGGVPTSNGDNNKVTTVEVTEFPRIYIALSRKEKEDDFLAMKGTKIPKRPKKRAKNIDRTLQYCFPGMWLSDLTKSRYEVREKKPVKKQKRRGGLKGMENFESDSE